MTAWIKRKWKTVLLSLQRSGEMSSSSWGTFGGASNDSKIPKPSKPIETSLRPTAEQYSPKLYTDPSALRHQADVLRSLATDQYAFTAKHLEAAANTIEHFASATTRESDYNGNHFGGGGFGGDSF